MSDLVGVDHVVIPVLRDCAAEADAARAVLAEAPDLLVAVLGTSRRQLLLLRDGELGL